MPLLFGLVQAKISEVHDGELGRRAIGEALQRLASCGCCSVQRAAGQGRAGNVCHGVARDINWHRRFYLEFSAHFCDVVLTNFAADASSNSHCTSLTVMLPVLEAMATTYRRLNATVRCGCRGVSTVLRA